MSAASLRDAILAALGKAYGKRIFHLHVLVSSPRRHTGLFPFASPRPRSFRQDIILLLSEQATADAPRVLVAAVEATVYSIPATDCAILYISKVDSSGHASAPSPTAALVRALLLHYGDPKTRPVEVKHLWIHLFARAQGQYLFANSAEFSGKQPLSDVRLCAWWQRMFSRVAEELQIRVSEPKNLKLFYLLPGLNELEAFATLKVASSSAPADATPSIPWAYSHPYSQKEIPLPCPEPAKGHPNLGNFIPYFDDDPKSRFIDEIAYTTDKDGIKSPAPKRRKVKPHQEASAESIGSNLDGKKDEDETRDKDEKPLGELGTVSPDEFWERMSFRQECVAGAVTGFFTLAISAAGAVQTAAEPSAVQATKFPANGIFAHAHPSASVPEAQAGHVSSQLTKRVMTTMLTGVEFSTVERAIRATETLEGAIKGLCEGLSSTGKPISTISGAATRSSSHNAVPGILHAPTPLRPNATQENLSTVPPPQTPPPRTPSPRQRRPRRDSRVDEQDNEPEAVASLDTYYLHIYGTISVDNPLPPVASAAESLGGGSETTAGSVKPVSSAAGQAPVTVLQVRRKKKRGD
ncbi:hypothetical protein HGRIS_005655 [Hohenbuehelia grisea]|uniref:histone acetyltransferase n=1 Tax=Hohenbuehelia grisea TaxID=104357 RepID=A0ABR3JYD3_9AGAR